MANRELDKEMQGKCFEMQQLLSEMDEGQMLGTIATFLSWEIGFRDMDVDEALETINDVVRTGVRRVKAVALGLSGLEVE